jgi:molybdate transport system permease protein
MRASVLPEPSGSRLPRWLWLPAAAGAAFIALPIVAIVARTDWRHFGSLITSDASKDALRLSLETASVSTALCLVLGVPMALVLARTTFPGQRLVRAVVLLPLVLPPVVGGLALLYTFGRRGLLGHTMDVLGIDIAFTTAAVVLAQTFVALPFLVISLEGALRTFGTRYDDVAATLGAGPSTVLRRVTLPLVLPALMSGTVLSFARALGEFGATIMFAGSLQGRTTTMPIQIYRSLEDNPDQGTALALVLVVVAVVIIAVTGRRMLGVVR